MMGIPTGMGKINRTTPKTMVVKPINGLSVLIMHKVLNIASNIRSRYYAIVTIYVIDMKLTQNFVI